MTLRGYSWKYFSILLLLSVSAVGAAERPRIAVCYFDDYSVPARADGAGMQKLFALLMVRTLEAADAFDVVDRTRIQEVVDSMKLEKFGMIEAGSVGKLTNADFMITGDFATFDGNTYTLNVRTLDMRSGELVKKAAQNAEVPLSESGLFCQEVTEKIAGAMRIKLSKDALKNIGQVNAQNAGCLHNIARALELRDQRKYAESLRALDSAAVSDPNWNEIIVQREQLQRLIKLQEEVQKPEVK